MGFIKEFKEFAVRGSMLDMAIGIIIGGAFGKIVSSFVADVMMPPLGLLMGKIDFKEKAIQLSTDAAGKAINLNYGLFVNALLDGTLVAFAIFLMIKAINRLKRQPAPVPPPPPNTKECPRCCSPIPIKATRCAHCTSDLAP